jgi:glycyl-tRNA synthetase
MKQALSQRQIEWIKKFDEGAKSLKCRNCRKFFTQTTYKKKKSLPICPHCGTHHQTKEDGTVTIRHRDSMLQERVALKDIKQIVLNAVQY